MSTNSRRPRWPLPRPPVSPPVASTKHPGSSSASEGDTYPNTPTDKKLQPNIHLANLYERYKDIENWKLIFLPRCNGRKRVMPVEKYNAEKVIVAAIKIIFDSET